jgi:3-phenylpropionate/trans-cinnamate dioxygenase ferredoxin component
MPRFVRAASLTDMPERGLLGVEVDGAKIVLIATGDGAYYALQDRCSHADFPLSDGQLIDGDRLECQYHGAKFDIASGRAVALPAIRPVKSYEVEIDGNDILVDLE